MSNESGKIKSMGNKSDKNSLAATTDALPQQYGIQVDRENLLLDKFPPGFLLGAGTSAVQVEGGWNSDGKGPSTWDTFCLESPNAIDDGSSAFVTCDSYNQWQDDVRLLKDLGCNTYKFSLSWSRILPNGDLSVINKKGIEYYKNLIETLWASGIEPLVVLHHFDLPSALGMHWNDSELIPHFVNYARLCFKELGSNVKRWITINEPWILTVLAHDMGLWPPQKHEPENCYYVVHNMIVAHAQAYRVYESEFKSIQKGKVGIAADCFSYLPATDSFEDEEATQRVIEFKFGIIAHPLIFGEYPPSMRDRIDALSQAEGRTTSRLPRIDSDLSKVLKGAVDFIGLNQYSCETVSANNVPEGLARINYSSSETIGFYNDMGTFNYFNPELLGSQAWWLKFAPWSLRPLLRRIRDTYDNIEILITENGYADTYGTEEDHDRANYHESYINETLKAVKLDGCNVTGYYAWCLLDGWEWASGHTCTFGIVHVDSNDPQKKRTPKLSAKVIGNIFKNRGFLRT